MSDSTTHAPVQPIYAGLFPGEVVYHSFDAQLLTRQKAFFVAGPALMQATMHMYHLHLTNKRVILETHKNKQRDQSIINAVYAVGDLFGAGKLTKMVHDAKDKMLVLPESPVACWSYSELNGKVTLRKHMLKHNGIVTLPVPGALPDDEGRLEMWIIPYDYPEFKQPAPTYRTGEDFIALLENYG